MTIWTEYLHRLDFLDDMSSNPTINPPVHVTVKVMVNGDPERILHVHRYEITGEPQRKNWKEDVASSGESKVQPTYVRLTVDAADTSLTIDPRTGNLAEQDPVDGPRVAGLRILVPIDDGILPPIDYSEDGERVTLTFMVGEIHFTGPAQ